MDSYEQTLTAKDKVWNMLEKLKTGLYQLDIAIDELPEKEVPIPQRTIARASIINAITSMNDAAHNLNDPEKY